MRLLSRWALDVFLVVFAIVECIALIVSAGSLGVSGAMLAALSAVALIGRRIQPLGASILSLVLLGACLYLLGESPTVVFFGLLVTFAIVAAINSTRDAVIVWLVGASMLGVAVWMSAPADAIEDFATTLALCTVMWTLGLLLSRRTKQATLMATRLQVTELERARAVHDEAPESPVSCTTSSATARYRHAAGPGAVGVPHRAGGSHQRHQARAGLPCDGARGARSTTCALMR